MIWTKMFIILSLVAALLGGLMLASTVYRCSDSKVEQAINFSEINDTKKAEVSSCKAYSCVYSYVEIDQRTIDASGKALLKLENFQGLIQIEGWAKSTIELKIRKRANSLKTLTQIDPIITDKDAVIEIQSPLSNMHIPYARCWQIDYLLKMPIGLQLQIEQTEGEISIVNMEGPGLFITGFRNKLQLQDVRSYQLQVNLVKGSVEALTLRSYNVQINLSTGDLTVSLPLGASYRMEAQVSSGNLQVTLPRSMVKSKWEQSGMNAQGMILIVGTGKGQIRLNVGIGNISIYSGAT